MSPIRGTFYLTNLIQVLTYFFFYSVLIRAPSYSRWLPLTEFVFSRSVYLSSRHANAFAVKNTNRQHWQIRQLGIVFSIFKLHSQNIRMDNTKAKCISRVIRTNFRGERSEKQTETVSQPLQLELMLYFVTEEICQPM